VEGLVTVTPERRSEPRTTVHQSWNVRVESRLFAHRLGQVVDYSPSGMRLILDGAWALHPGDQIDIHYLGTSFSCLTAVCWSSEKNGQTVIGVQLLNDLLQEHQAA
jgi:hypothetical protein